jgi:23S rRNA pseudouridine1911/1915/1917 synthase
MKPDYIPDIIFEDNHLIAISKKAGDLSQPDSSGKESLPEILINFIKERDHKPGNVYLGMLHRLDQQVTGALIFAKTSKSAARMALLFRSRDVDKFYLAITSHQNELLWSDRWTLLEDTLIREGDRTFAAKDNNPDAQSGSLLIKTIMTDQHVAVHLIKLVTGRKHQIRAQLSSRALPIIGDSRYDSSIKFENGIALHSFMLAFEHPVRKEPVTVVAKIPESFVRFAEDNNLRLPDESDLLSEIGKQFSTRKVSP